MTVMDAAVLDSELARQKATLDALPLLADIAHSDVLYYDFIATEHLKVLRHAQPHSAPSLYAQDKTGALIRLDKGSLLGKAIVNGAHNRGELWGNDLTSLPAQHEVLPVRNQDGKVIGAISIETSQTEQASQRHRHPAINWRVVLDGIKEAIVQGALPSCEHLSGCDTQDGLIVVDKDLRVIYADPIAAHSYRMFGAPQPLTEKPISLLGAGDERLITQAIQEQTCLEREDNLRDFIWLRKVVPLYDAPLNRTATRRWLNFGSNAPNLKMALVLVRDVSTQRRAEQEATRQAAMMKEIHHRVKNNLQTLISLARFQVRRAQSEETKQALSEITNRIFAIAQVHDLLASDDLSNVQFRNLCQQIAMRVQETFTHVAAPFIITVEGDPVRLPSRQATACALIVNELVQNAVEHAFEPNQDPALIRIELEENAHRVRIAVVDNGRGVPEGFDYRTTNSLGLKIVRTLAQDLQGELTLTNQPNPQNGLRVQVSFAKI